MNEQSIPKTPMEDEKDLYKKFQYKGYCTTCVKYGHKPHKKKTPKQICKQRHRRCNLLLNVYNKKSKLKP